MNTYHRATRAGTLVRSGGYWCTPFGRYKRLGNAIRFLKKNGLTYERKYDIDIKIIDNVIKHVPFFKQFKLIRRE